MAPSSRSRGNSEAAGGCELVIHKQPDSVVLAGSFVEVELQLMQPKSNATYNNKKQIKFDVEVISRDDMKGKIEFQIDDGTPSLFPLSQTREHKSITIHIKISTLSGNNRFAFEFKAKPGQGCSIEPVTTRFFHCAKYRFRILKQPPPHWYKDGPQQGRCIEFQYAIVDANDHRPRSLNESNNKIHTHKLNYELLYQKQHDYQEDTFVTSQKILKLEADCDKQITLPNVAMFHGKITEISKNHMKQNFCIRVTLAAEGPMKDLAQHVGYGETTPITVFSKKNSSKKRKTTDSLASDLINDASSNRDLRPSLTISSRTEQLHHIEGNARTFTEAEISSLMKDGTANSSAIAEVLAWCQFINKELERLEWQHVGFEVTEDGNLNLNFPLYRCPGCWNYRDNIRTAVHMPMCALYRGLRVYKERVIKHLETLSQAAIGGSNKNNTTNKKNNTSKINNHEDSDSDDADDDDDVKNTKKKQRLANLVHMSDLQTDSMDLSSMVPMANRGSSLTSGIVPLGISFPSISMNTGFEPVMNPLSRNNSEMFNNRQMMTNAYHDDYMSDFSFEENKVYYIVVKQTPSGFAAFSEAMSFVGYYLYSDCRNSLTFVAATIQDNANKIESEFQEQLKNQGQATIVTKEEHITLHQLKEAALLAHFENMTNAFTI